VDQPIWEQQNFPEKLFRFLVLICLVGCGGSAIYVFSHAGSMEDAIFRARDLASYSFTAIWIFVFFYAQYRVVPRFLHRDLDRRIGLAHAGGSFLLLTFGALNVLLPQVKSDLPSSVLFWMTLLGETVFIGNAIWSYVSGERTLPVLPVVPSAKRTPEHVPDPRPKNLGWPKSPAKLFGIGAGFFAGAGLISILFGVPSFPIPLPIGGQMDFMPYGALWLAAAVPFGIFALLYWYLSSAQRIVFEESLNRAHFLVTIVATFDLVRVFMAWEETLVSKTAAMYFGPEFQWLTAFYLVSAAVFAVSVYRSSQRKSAHL